MHHVGYSLTFIIILYSFKPILNFTLRCHIIENGAVASSRGILLTSVNFNNVST